MHNLPLPDNQHCVTQGQELALVGDQQPGGACRRGGTQAGQAKQQLASMHVCAVMQAGVSIAGQAAAQAGSLQLGVPPSEQPCSPAMMPVLPMHCWKRV